jgi:hypothetical protein
MFKRYNFLAMASAAIIVVASSTPLHAGGLRGTVGGALDGLGGAVGDTVGGITGGVTGSVTSSIGKTNATVGAVTSKGLLSADAKSNILRGIMAKARVLSPEELARLCLATGGGDAGCGSGNKPRILGLIDARLNVLSDRRLIRVCTSVGAGCGGSSSIASVGSKSVVGAIGAEEVLGGGVPGISVPSSNVPASNVPDTNAANAKRANRIVGGMSDREVVAYKKRCVNVLQSPQRYDSDIVSLCRLIKRQKV